MAIGTYDPVSKTWTPDPAFTAELTNDPAALGYKSAGAWKSAAAIGQLLTDPHGTVANPVTVAPQIPKPFVYTDVLGLLSAASQANIRALPELTRVLDDINAQNRHAVAVWANLCLAGTSPPILQSEHDAIVNLMNATIADPNWTATIPAPSRLEQVFGVGVVASGLITTVTGVA